jgi:hypothetical protein
MRCSNSAAAVNFSPTAGAPFSGAVATFTTPDRIDGAAAFTAVITWGDGSSSSVEEDERQERADRSAPVHRLGHGLLRRLA